MDRLDRGRAEIPATAALVAAALVCAVALYLRSSGLAGGSIAFDEADYAYAASRGLWTNWWDQSGGLNGDLRHWHAPLSMYLIGLSTAAFGTIEWAVRLPGVIAGAGACTAMTLATIDLADGSPRARLAAGVLGGLLLATAPASIGLAGTATPHTVVELLLVLNLWSLARYARRPSTKGAAWFGLSLGGQFVTMDYGFIILGLALVAVALSAAWRFGAGGGTAPRVSPGRHMLACGLACGVVVLALWPAGVLKAGVVRNLMYYVEYARHGHATLFLGQIHQQVPKWAYAWWYWESFPVLLLAMLAGLVLLGVWVVRTRDATAIVMGVFAAGLLASIHASHIMHLKYSAFALPAVLLGGVLAGGWSWRALLPYDGGRGRASRVTAAALLVIAAAGVAGGSVTRGPPDDTADNAKRLAIRAVPRFMPGDRVVAYPWPILRYVAHLEMGRPDIQVLEFSPNQTRREAASLKRLQAGEAEWAYIREPLGGIRDSPVFRFLVASYVLADQEGDVRLFRRPR